MTAVSAFGELDGEPVERITLTREDTRVGLLTLGAILQELRVGADGRNLVLGCDSVAAYRDEQPYSGAIVGPVANRIRGATAQIDGATFTFDANYQGDHTLHGGVPGTAGRIWAVTEREDHSATFTLRLPDGESGFPGDRTITATYALTSPFVLELRLEATTDRPTFMSLAHHPHWTLDPDAWDGQELWVDAQLYLPTDEAKLPTGKIVSVDGTRFDFRKPRRLSSDAASIDHNYCLAEDARPCQTVARLRGKCGLTLDIATTAPGLQVFLGNPKGIALEPQHWPDAPANPIFPSIRLDPGETWQQTTRYTIRP